MGVFDDEKYYDKSEFDKLSFTEQKNVFLRIRSWVATVPKEVRYNKDLYEKTILRKIEQICSYACSGHIPSQDYVGYIYKRGFGDFFPVNYKRALEWNIIASSNCSKLAPQKMKVFLNPAIDMIVLCDKWPQIIEFNGLNKANYYWFLSQYVCDILYKDLNLNPGEMAKKPLIEKDEDERRIVIFYDRFRNRSVETAIKKLSEEIPSELKVEEKNAFGEDLLEGDDDDNIEINLDDI